MAEWDLVLAQSPADGQTAWRTEWHRSPGGFGLFDRFPWVDPFPPFPRSAPGPHWASKRSTPLPFSLPYLARPRHRTFLLTALTGFASRNPYLVSLNGGGAYHNQVWSPMTLLGQLQPGVLETHEVACVRRGELRTREDGGRSNDAVGKLPRRGPVRLKKPAAVVASSVPTLLCLGAIRRASISSDSWRGPQRYSPHVKGGFPKPHVEGCGAVPVGIISPLSRAAPGGPVGGPGDVFSQHLTGGPAWSMAMKSGRDR